MIGACRSTLAAGLVSILLAAPPVSGQNAAAPSKWAPGFPLWAALWNPEFPHEPTNEDPYHVPNSSETITMKHARNLFFSPDWHPDRHPALPDVVLYGRQPEVWACGSCHRAEGTGGPDDAPIARLVYAKDPDGGTEPLGDRIVEMLNDLKQFEMHDSQPHLTVYVPVGSLAKGAMLVTAVVAYLASLTH